ncbi:MAG: rcc01693 family protein [Paracoccaceae bacterium]
MSGLDWPSMLQAGVQGLRLTPAQFWALTPAELKLMLGQANGQVPMARAGLEALEQAYPDQTRKCRDGESEDG